MNILHGTVDIANQAATIIPEFNRLGHKARFINQEQNYLNYNCGLEYKIDLDVIDFLNNYDVYQFYFNTGAALDKIYARNKVIIPRFYGSEVRQKSIAEKLNPIVRVKFENEGQIVNILKFWQRYTHTCIVSDAETYEYVKDYFEDVIIIPCHLNLSRYKRVEKKNKKPVIVHAPTDRRCKGTEYVLSAAEKLKDKYEFILVEGKSHDEAKRIYASADLIIDQLLTGWYGMVSLEAMAMGVPSICYISDFMNEHNDIIPPIIQTSPDGLVETIERTLDDRMFLKKISREGLVYVREHHDVCKIAPKYINVYERLLGEKKAKPVQVSGKPKIENGKSTISACLIVKDEEDYLFDCLASIEHYVDEIILVDTGSTDKTKEIAQEFNCKIYDYKWDDDFSAARNFSISKATKDWIFIIDADERIPPQDGMAIRKFLDDTEHDIVVVSVLNMYGQPRMVGGRVPSLRFFRRSYEPSYTRRWHNQPVVKKGTVLCRIPFRILHYGYDLPKQDMIKKAKRVIRMGQRFIKDNPDDPEAWYQYANALKTNIAIQGQHENKEKLKEVIEALEKGLRLSNGNNDGQNVYLETLSLMAWIQHAYGDHEKAIEYAKRALIFKSDYLDAIFTIAMAYTYGIDIRQGEDWCNRYLREQELYKFDEKTDSIAMEHANDRKLVYQALIDIENAKDRNLMRGI